MSFASQIPGALVAWFAYRRSGDAVEAARRSALAAERSAGASERSADTAEATAGIARDDFEMRRRQVAARLALVVLKVEGDGRGGGRVVFEIRNDGGSVARRVAPQAILVNGDVRFGVSGVAESIAPGDSSQFIGYAPSVVQYLERGAIEEFAYIDSLGSHDNPEEPLHWPRTA